MDRDRDRGGTGRDAPRRRWWLAAVPAAALLVALGAVALGLAGGGGRGRDRDSPVGLSSPATRTEDDTDPPSCGGQGQAPRVCVAWSAGLPATGGGADRLAVAADRVALLRPDGDVEVRRRDDGGRLWAAHPSGTVRLHGWVGDLLVATVDSRLVGMTAAGRRWSVRLPADVEQLGQFGAGVRRVLAGPDAAPYVVAGAELVALEPADGSVRWRWGRQHVLSAGVARSGPYVVVVDGVVGLDPATGRRRWRAPMVTFDNRPNLVVDGWIVIGDDSGRVSGLDPGTGAVAWVHRVRDGALARRLRAAGGVVVADTGGGRLVGLDAATGTVRWRRTAGRGRELAGAAGTIAVAVDDGRVVGLDAATGRFRWEVRLGQRIADVEVGPVSVAVATGRVWGLRGRDVVSPG